MTPKEKLEFDKLKEENTFMKEVIDSFAGMEDVYNSTNYFVRKLTGHLHPTVIEMIMQKEPIILSLKKTKTFEPYYITVTTSKLYYEFQIPLLPNCSGNGSFTTNQAAQCQKIIDCWFKVLKENIEFWAQYYNTQVDVKIQNICACKNSMFYYTYTKDNVTVFHIHPYFENKYPNEFLEIKEKIDYNMIHEKGIINREYIITNDIFEKED